MVDEKSLASTTEGPTALYSVRALHLALTTVRAIHLAVTTDSATVSQLEMVGCLVLMMVLVIHSAAMMESSMASR